MTQEEKARAYDEALKKIQPLYEQAKKDDNPIWSTYEYLIPELRESDDERIRKALIQFLNDIKSISESGRTSWAVRKEDAEMCNSFITYLEKRKEQKPAEWSDTDNIGWDEAFACVTRAEKAAKNEEELQNAITAEKWLKEIKFKYCVHPIKQEWSEEDKDYYDTIVRKLEVIGDDSGLSNNQIKFLREHYPSYHSEWSEEDESELTAIIYCVSQAIKASKDENERNSLLSAKKWLQDKLSFRVKSLRPSWKPSEEQMEELWNVISYIEQPDSNFLGVPVLLESLYEQLKKL